MPTTRRRTSDPRANVNLDELDHQILEFLQVDGRASFREIARSLGVSEGTIRGRSNRMQADGVVTFAAITDPFKVGYQTMAFCLIKVRAGAQQEAIDALAETPEVIYISSCIGRADLYIQVISTDHQHLWRLLTETISAMGGIESVETFEEIKLHKVSYVYPLTVSNSGTPAVGH